MYGLSLSEVQTNQIFLLDRSQILSFGNHFSEIKKKKAIYLFRVLVIKSNLTSEALIAIMKGSEYSKSSKIDKAIKV